VTISTAPGDGSVFEGWTGACAGQGTTCLLTMTADLTTSARFDLAVSATPAPATAQPTVTAAPTAPSTPSAPPSPAATASAAPGGPGPGNSSDPPWLPIVVVALLALVAVGIAAFRLGTRRSGA
jgi:hypothetical protein